MLCVCVCARAPFSCWNKVIDFHGIRYKHYAAVCHPNLEHVNHLQSVLTTWRTYELLEMGAKLILSPEIMYDNRPSRNMQLLLR
jgi:hypothetical protein